jgi:hypothetical protein
VRTEPEAETESKLPSPSPSPNTETDSPGKPDGGDEAKVFNRVIIFNFFSELVAKLCYLEMMLVFRDFGIGTESSAAKSEILRTDWKENSI